MNKIERTLIEKKSFLIVKRIFDILSSGLGLIILAIPMLIIALIIKLNDGGDVFFRQVRVGKNQKNFNILKFRTMVEGAPKMGAAITVQGDNRITKVGHFLRKSKLDELPQLINVFRGDMSVVGPRPEVPKYVDMYSDEEKEVLLVRPGITDIASIEYRDESSVLEKALDPEKTYVEEIMPHKLKLNRKYIENMGLLYDIGLIFKTFKAILD